MVVDYNYEPKKLLKCQQSKHKKLKNKQAEIHIPLISHNNG